LLVGALLVKALLVRALLVGALLVGALLVGALLVKALLVGVTRQPSAATRPPTVVPPASYSWRVVAGELWLGILRVFRGRVCAGGEDILLSGGGR
jgi:hypothetical protein